MANKERIRPNARAKAAALREKERRREARRRMLLALGAVAAVAAVIGTLVAVRLATDGKQASDTVAAITLDPATATKVTTLPAATLEAVGRGTVATLPKAVSGPPLVKDGKPKVVYIGAEYCPYCAAERWPMVVALSRFGTWRNLGATTSGGKPEPFPNTPTFSFHGASFSSPYVVFEGVETETNKKVGDRFEPLDKLTSEQEQLLKKYQPSGGIPFIDFGNKFTVGGASYDPTVLEGKSLTQIADDLTKPGTAIAKAIGGTANAHTAAICTLTKNQPAKVCDAADITTLRGQLGGG